jgi:hypothetical protein
MLLLLRKCITHLFWLEELNMKLLSIWIRKEENFTRLAFLGLKIIQINLLAIILATNKYNLS